MGTSSESGTWPLNLKKQSGFAVGSAAGQIITQGTCHKKVSCVSTNRALDHVT